MMYWKDKQLMLQSDMRILSELVATGRTAHTSWATRNELMNEFGSGADLTAFVQQIRWEGISTYSEALEEQDPVNGLGFNEVADGIRRLSALGFIEICIKTRETQGIFEGNFCLHLTEFGKILMDSANLVKGLSYLDLAVFGDMFGSFGPILIRESELWEWENDGDIESPGLCLSGRMMNQAVKFLSDRILCFGGSEKRVEAFVRRLEANHLLIENRLGREVNGVGGGGAEVRISERGIPLGQALKGLSQRWAAISPLRC